MNLHVILCYALHECSCDPSWKAVRCPISRSLSWSAVPVRAKVWAAKIAEYDGVAFVTPEHNRSPSGVLKNPIDFVYEEWANKAAALVGYGASGRRPGDRAPSRTSGPRSAPTMPSPRVVDTPQSAHAPATSVARRAERCVHPARLRGRLAEPSMTNERKV
ncbi:NADPH-dependent FMN reductase [Streptomyces sp. NPDC087851]|uniref:NADPH-dependent FMN reductase n=1 Tax=Streptomyces sp. NPDC087851 TaxID=3365810 RepID=UPI00380E0028